MKMQPAWLEIVRTEDIITTSSYSESSEIEYEPTSEPTTSDIPIPTP